MNENDTCPNGKPAVQTLFQISIHFFFFFLNSERLPEHLEMELSCLQLWFSGKHSQPAIGRPQF